MQTSELSSLRPKLLEVFNFAQVQLKKLIKTYPDYFPVYTENGKWKHEGEPWTNWCEGFLGGQLWLIYQHTGDPWWREKAKHYSRLIEHRKFDRDVHDLGFLFWSTWKPWYDETGDESKNQVVIEAGRTLALRFKEKGGYLCSFVSENSLFIDIMMNVGIIFYAAEQSEDRSLWSIANRHCLTTRRYLVREDGSTAHEGIFNTLSGEFLYQSTRQGWSSDSSWARGLAWAMYGFGTAYFYTRDPRFLETAEACANFYIEKTPDIGVPPNDWDEPDPAVPYESSAAAIAAGGFWNLAGLITDKIRSNRYREYALNILETLASPEFLATGIPGWEGILKHAIYHQSKGLGVDESVIWGDYFFLKIINKVVKDE